MLSVILLLFEMLFSNAVKLMATTRFFFISILFISISRLKSVENKHNLSITKAQIRMHKGFLVLL